MPLSLSMLKDKSLYIGPATTLFCCILAWLLKDVKPADVWGAIMPYVVWFCVAVGAIAFVWFLWRVYVMIVARRRENQISRTLDILKADGEKGFKTPNGLFIKYVPEYSAPNEYAPDKKEFSAAEWEIICPNRRDYPITDDYGTCRDAYCPNWNGNNYCELFGSILQAIDSRIKNLVNGKV